ncbi:MAG: endonuclease III [Candidatus Brockarchaeota archaeon]|nr:endonuclease III [Candidatus Brockarchaeota archaeon]
MKKINGETILRKLGEAIMLDEERFQPLRSRSVFEMLVATILSQNTSDKNTARTIRRLRETIGITPQSISNAGLLELKSAIRSSGLYNVKARVLKKLARIVIKNYGGNFEKVLEKPLDEARRELMSLPGVGPKTADVILLFAGGKKTFPIDTHVFRVSRRLGLIGLKDSYEDARGKLMKTFPPESYLKAHLLLIEHGRKTCGARRPLCSGCVLLEYCSFGQEFLKRKTRKP